MKGLPENKRDTIIIYPVENYEIEIAYNYDLVTLEQQWTKIELASKTSFFLSWKWMSNWIKTCTPELIIVSAKYNNDLVAIGLFTNSNESRHKFITSKQLKLHQTGDNSLDQIWIEYNDFICTPEHQHSAVNACLKAMQEKICQWDEIIFSMTTSFRYKSFMSNNIKAKVVSKTPCYAVDLKQLRNDHYQYIDTVSTNTRYQVRRSIRGYEQLFGEIKLITASSRQEAIKFFHEAGCHHKKRWEDSGFENHEFIKFHENLIQNNFTYGAVELIKVTTGVKTIAIMYNFIHNKHVYFYLQGIQYESDKKLKPGLVAHSVITQFYLDKGMDLYDYMGGYSQYKSQLASHSTDCYTICIQRPRFSFLLENLGRKLKHLSGL